MMVRVNYFSGLLVSAAVVAMTFPVVASAQNAGAQPPQPVTVQSAPPTAAEALDVVGEVLGGTDSGTPAPPAIPSPGEVVPAVPMPDAAPLMPPESVPGAADAAAADSSILPESVSGTVSTDEVAKPGAKPAQPDVYYDSRLNVPSSDLAESVGPRKVDPTLEPASKLVIARKDFNATDQESMLVAANRALELGRYESALELFNELHRKNKRDARILMGRGITQQKLGMNDQAILSYEALLEINPKSIDAVINLTGLIREQYPEVALRRLGDLQKEYPSNAGIAAQLGLIFASRGANKEALVALGKAASLQPNNATHVYNMAVISDRMGNKQQAINYYERALEADAVYGDGRSVPRESIYDRLSRLRGS